MDHSQISIVNDHSGLWIIYFWIKKPIRNQSGLQNMVVTVFSFLNSYKEFNEENKREHKIHQSSITANLFLIIFLKTLLHKFVFIQLQTSLKSEYFPAKF